MQYFEQVLFKKDLFIFFDINRNSFDFYKYLRIKKRIILIYFEKKNKKIKRNI